MANWIKFLIIVFGLGYGLLLIKTYELQILKNDYYLARANSQYEKSISLKALRGNIYFKDNENNLILAATNKDFPLIYAVPKEFKDTKETIANLETVLNLSPKIKDSLNNKESKYVLLLRKASPEIVQKIKNLNLSGVYISNLSERFYPLGSLAAHLLGYVGQNELDSGEKGLYGVEKLYDEKLQGENGKINGSEIIEPKPGEDVILTIDVNIEKEAERILESLIQNQKAKGGLVIVAEPHTGKILAMAGFPNFNPNEYFKYEISNFLNPVVSKIYEPGSVLKVITMAAGIDSGKVNLDTTFFDTGSLTLNGKTIRNWDFKSYGKVTMSQIIEHSINTGAAFIQRQMGRDIFLKYLKKFGLDKKTGIDLPGEVAGSLKSLNSSAPDINFATASFGQGIAVTPIELIMSISAIANGGKLMRPYLNANLGPEVVDTVISKETAEKVKQMMVSAVDKAGVAKIKGFSIAGKTGTAQVPDIKNGGYKDAYIHSYIGFGPASNPKFIILIRIDEPQGAQLAGLTVVPAFRELAEFILNYYRIPPDRIED